MTSTAARVRGSVVVVLVGLVAAACTPGGGPTQQASAPPAPASTGVTETEPITLTVWDQEYGQVGKVWDQLNAEFEDKYPNVTINRVKRDFSELKALSRLALQGPNAPDIVEVNQGWPDMGQLVKAGLLLPLDNYADAYGWTDRVSPNVLAVSSWTPDGSQFGTGNLFGYTTLGELIGVYYNRAKLDAMGLDVPTTFSEFEQDLATIRQSGDVPIMFGNGDQWPGIHEYAIIQDQMADKSYLTDLIFGLGDGQLSFDTPENTQAAATLLDWANQGYFSPGFGGSDYQSEANDFAKGEGVFMIAGNWLVADLGPKNRDFGFFLLPPSEAGAPPVSTGGAGYPLSITSKTDHPDAAAAYIDWMTNEHASDLLVATGQLPLSTSASTSTAEPGTVLADVLTAASSITESNGVVPYEDWATPTFFDTMSAGIQELMVARISPEQFVARVQADYAEFQSSRT